MQDGVHLEMKEGKRGNQAPDLLLAVLSRVPLLLVLSLAYPSLSLRATEQA